jgi:hypothetical protein
MSKTALSFIVILSSFCGVLLLTSGCGKSKNKELKARPRVSEAAPPRQIIVKPQSPPAPTVKTPENNPTQLPSAAKQAEPLPPPEQTASPLSSQENTPHIAHSPARPLLVQPAAPYGEQVSTETDEHVNPLRTPEQFPPLRSQETPLESSDRSIPAPLTPKPETPPQKSPESSLNISEQSAVAIPTKTVASSSTGQQSRVVKLTDVPFDPIKENGLIFEGWSKPKLALVITGQIAGYIEPCGCAGLERMKGGMSRRYTLFKELRERGWAVVGLDVGGLAKGFGRQAEIKFQTLVEGMRKMGYQAIALGLSDLRLPAGELAAVAANVEGQESPFVSANVGLFGFDSGMTSTYRIVSAGSTRIGITAVLGKSYQKEIHSDELEMLDPETALQKVLPEMKKQSDVLILLAHATVEETTALARRFPVFDVVVTSGGPPEPPDNYKIIEGTKSLLIEVGEKGMNAIVLGLYDDPNKSYRYQRVALDSRFAASPEMTMLMAAYQEQLKALGFAALGLRPMPHPQTELNGKFVGSNKCEPCHEESYRIWKKSLHSQAYETLVKNDPPRNYDPECVSCHVMGWNPTQFFPYQGGYESPEKTPQLIDVGCEACHGPGEKHVAAESGSNEKLMEKYRLAVRLTKADSEKYFCATCHDLDNSPDYDFKTYWPLVEHYETTEPDENEQQ